MLLHPNVLINNTSSAIPTILTILFSRHKADYIKSNTHSKPSSRAQQRLACVPKRTLSCLLSRCVVSVSSLVRSHTHALAFEWRARVIPTKNVPYRRPHRHRDRRPHIRCASPQVCAAYFSHNIRRALFSHLPVQQFYAPASHGLQDGVQPTRPRQPARIRHRR